MGAGSTKEATWDGESSPRKVRSVWRHVSKTYRLGHGTFGVVFAAEVKSGSSASRIPTFSRTKSAPIARPKITVSPVPLPGADISPLHKIATLKKRDASPSPEPPRSSAASTASAASSISPSPSPKAPPLLKSGVVSYLKDSITFKTGELDEALADLEKEEEHEAPHPLTSAIPVVGESLPPQVEVAVKVIERNRAKSVKKLQKLDFINEVNIMRKLSFSKHVIRYLGSLIDKRFFCIAVEICRGGNVLEYFLKLPEKRATEMDASMCVKHLLLAIHDVHSCNIAHLDLKPENILLQYPNDPGSIRLIDFGCAKFTHDESGKSLRYTEFGGTIMYAAPEVSGQYVSLEGDGIKAVDMWAIGILCFQIVTGKHPFLIRPGQSVAELRARIFKGEFEFPEDVPISSAAKKFICRLIEKDPKLRMTAADALLDDWIERPEECASKEKLDPVVLAGLKAWQNQNLLVKLVGQLLAKIPMKESDLARTKDSFKELDINGDGFVQVDELAKFLKDRLGRSEEMADEEAKKIFTEYDTNSDGVLSLEEFIEISWRGLLATRSDAVRDAFKILDENKDGMISQEELVRVLGEDISDEDLAALLDQVDSNSDGFISFDEFVTACESLKTSKKI